MARRKAIELDRVEKPLWQMCELLKNLPDDPTPEQVHKLRTRARRIEAVATALEPVDGKAAKQLVKAIKPVRKAAGDVRDMDVLTRGLLGMPKNGMNGSLNGSRARLVEHLNNLRRQSAGELMEAVSRQRKTARRQLKKFARTAESVAIGKKPARIEVSRTFASEDGNGSPASKLIVALSRWPKLNAHNVHPFRLKVKELRYVLQLFPDADEKLIEALAKVNNQIGDWHDWHQLGEIAQKILDFETDKTLLQKIRTAEKRKLTRALASAESLRKHYLRTNDSHRKLS